MVAFLFWPAYSAGATRDRWQREGAAHRNGGQNKRHPGRYSKAIGPVRWRRCSFQMLFGKRGEARSGAERVMCRVPIFGKHIEVQYTQDFGILHPRSQKHSSNPISVMLKWRPFDYHSMPNIWHLFSYNITQWRANKTRESQKTVEQTQSSSGSFISAKSPKEWGNNKRSRKN